MKIRFSIFIFSERSRNKGFNTLYHFRKIKSPIRKNTITDIKAAV